jgi:molybdenum cofactor biosynthesis enzyme MoaA
MKDRLVSSGLRAVTFHLDTLMEARYSEVMGHGSVGRVLDAIDEAKALALLVKINVVVQGGLNDDELDWKTFYTSRKKSMWKSVLLSR